MSNTVLVMGPAGSGKSTFALSGEGLTAYMEFDPGSFARAAKGRDIDMSRVILTKHYPPLTSLLDIGEMMKGAGGGLAPQAARILKGWLETYEAFVRDYLNALDNADVTSIVIDTETRMWLTVRQAYLQQAQDASDTKALDQLHYTEPNARYDQILVAAKIYEKDLVLVSHLKEEYKGNKGTGRMIHDGYKEAPDGADLTLEFSVEDRMPVARVRDKPMALDGFVLPAPTLGYCADLLDAAAAIQRSGLEMPEEPDAVIDLAKVLA